MFRSLCLLALAAWMVAQATQVLPTCTRKCSPGEISQRPDCDSCSSFLMCVHGFAFHFRCPNGLHYDSIRGHCDTQRLAKCGTEKASGTNNIQETLSPEAGGCVDGCEGVAEGVYPSCQGCNRYVICVRKQTFPVKCPGSRVWDNDQQECLATSSTCSM